MLKVINKIILFLVLLLAFVRLPAQLCQGSLGDPIINITFGSGPNPGPSLSSTKNLNYKFGDCPNDGFYTIANSTSGCFNNTWHALQADHTGDANGYFMLINASLQKSEFYIDTLTGLCPNTTYEFAAWVMNVQSPSAPCNPIILPNISFNIETTDGTVLQTYSTGDISGSQSPIWLQYGFFFTTTANVSNIVLRLLNNSRGGCGNDLAIDDITFRPCGPKITPSIKGVAGLEKELCAGENADVMMECNVSAGYNNPSFLWQQSNDGGNTWTNIAGEIKSTIVTHFSSTTAVGEYKYRVSVSEAANAGSKSCRVSSSLLTVRVNTKPATSILTNSPTCEGTKISLTATGGSEGLHYNWSGPNSFSAEDAFTEIVNVKAVNGGKYFLETVSNAGCKKLDSAVISILPGLVVTTNFSSKTICEGDSVSLQSGGGTSYQWLPSSGLSSSTISNPIARPTDSVIYKVFATNANKCTDSATVIINVIKVPKVSAGPDKEMVEGQSVQLEGTVSGSANNSTFAWSPNSSISDVHSLQPIVRPKLNATYILTATGNNGCGSASDATNVHVFKKVIIPNAFSPNGDGINDGWNITALAAYNDYVLSVFNRYGQIVFYSKSYSTPWDGTFNNKPLPIGTYYYVLDLKLGLPKMTGFVVILR